MTATVNNQKYIADIIRNTRQFWTAYEFLKAQQDQWNAGDYLNKLIDGDASNNNVTTAAVGAVVFDTMNAIATLLSQGYATNITKLL